MTDLIRLEHKKLWGRRSTKISVFLCFFYVIVIVNILCFQWFSYGSSGDHTSAFGNHFDGYTMIRDSKEYSRTFGGELTDETLQRMVKEYQDMAAADLDRERQLTDRPKIDSWLEQLYPELRDTGTYYTMITYADPEKLTGFYERRTQALEDFLEISEQTGAERAYLLQMEEKVEKPFSYEFLEGWSNILTSMAAELGTVMALFLAVVLSPLFSGEWRDSPRQDHHRTALYHRVVPAPRRGWVDHPELLSRVERMGYADPDDQADRRRAHEHAAGGDLRIRLHSPRRARIYRDHPSDFRGGKK